MKRREYILLCLIPVLATSFLLLNHSNENNDMAPEGEERLGDVSNVVFSNGWILDDDGKVFIYYASSDTRMHVAISSVERLLDYVMNTPADGLRSASSVERLIKLIKKNKAYLKEVKLQPAGNM